MTANKFRDRGSLHVWKEQELIFDVITVFSQLQL